MPRQIDIPTFETPVNRQPWRWPAASSIPFGCKPGGVRWLSPMVAGRGPPAGQRSATASHDRTEETGPSCRPQDVSSPRWLPAVHVTAQSAHRPQDLHPTETEQHRQPRFIRRPFKSAGVLRRWFDRDSASLPDGDEPISQCGRATLCYHLRGQLVIHDCPAPTGEMSGAAMRTRLNILELVIVVTALLGSGCGDSQPTEILDAQSLLNRYELDRRRHDPTNFREVDLGQFYVSLRDDRCNYQVRFHMFGVLPDDQLSRFEQTIEPYSQRVRDAVIRTVQGSAPDQLRAPSLQWLKGQLLDAVNQCLRTRILRDVVFTEFSFEQN